MATMSIDRQAVTLDERLAALWARCCEGKVAMSARAARAVAAQSRIAPTTPDGTPVNAYRCPFASEHDDPGADFHVGRPISVETMVEVAGLLRARSGNSPGPQRKDPRP